MAVHIVVAAVIQYLVTFLLNIMGNQSSCSVIDFSWNSMGLWLILLAAAAGAIYYYRHRIRRSTRRKIYRAGGGDMDLYKNFLEWRERQEIEPPNPHLRAIEPPRQYNPPPNPPHRQQPQPDQPYNAPAPRAHFPRRQHHYDDLESGLESLLPLLRALQAQQQTRPEPTASPSGLQSPPASGRPDIASPLARQSVWQDV